jgi:hypothetical protein
MPTEMVMDLALAVLLHLGLDYYSPPEHIPQLPAACLQKHHSYRERDNPPKQSEGQNHTGVRLITGILHSDCLDQARSNTVDQFLDHKE